MKQWNCLEALMMITKDGENVPHLEITVVVSVHCNIVNNNYQQRLSCIHLFLINHMVNC